MPSISTPLRFALLSVVAALALASVMLSGRGATAATPVYADPAGTCAGLSPCYTTVQAAVNNAGPPAALVIVFPGTYNETVDLSLMGSAIAGTPGDIIIQAVDAAGAPAAGTATINAASAEAIWESVFPFPGSVTIDGFILTSAFDAIVDLSATGDITFSDNVASGGIGTGVSLDTDGNLVVARSTFNQNAFAGANIDAVGDVTITDSTANENGDDGFTLDSSGSGTITVTGSTANGNDDEGFDLSTDGDVNISGTTGNDNISEGIEIDSYDSFVPAGVSISDTTTNDNDDDGIDAVATNLTITNTTANGNSDEGLDTGVIGDVSIDRATTLNNGSGGIDIEGLSEGALNSATVTNSLVMGNTNNGIESLGSSSFIDGPLNYNSNVICGNPDAGFESLADEPNNAEGNWWGAASGPTHPSNASGTGDIVYDGANPGPNLADGTVDFDPWIATGSGSGSAVAGQASPINFEFTGGSGSVKLQEGPGDETGTSPFTVATNNGTATVGFIDAGKLAVSLTAATAGTANVTVTGPCGLTATVSVVVAAAQTSPVVTPGQLPSTGATSGNGSIPVSVFVAAMAFAAVGAFTFLAVRRSARG